ncbi:unnamed protein product, partial [Iphiclides podalirius]
MGACAGDFGAFRGEKNAPGPTVAVAAAGKKPRPIASGSANRPIVVYEQAHRAGAVDLNSMRRTESHAANEVRARFPPFGPAWSGNAAPPALRRPSERARGKGTHARDAR